MSNVLLVICPRCGEGLAVTEKVIREHPQGIVTCQTLMTVNGKKVKCGVQHTVTRLEKEFWRGTWSPENEDNKQGELL